METFGDVSVTLADNHVAEVEMHRPPANFFDAPLLGHIVESIDWADQRGGRVVVLCSEGRHFCAGYDFGSSEAPEPAGLRTLYDQAVALINGPLPVVVAVQGSAVGGGLGLAMAGDFRVAAPTSRFSANFARLGLHPGFGLSATLPRVVGEQHALDLFYSGRRIDGGEALRIGLCDRVADDPRAGAHALAEEIAASAPLAVRSIRSTMRAGWTDGFTAAIEHERLEQLRLMGTDDFREGIEASLQRRHPNFAGR
ncbi:MAG: enoyl-CoA hydratase/isomerase family protein [Acidimicrobiales bacterium]|nr:enoyl-CoA hydratase/isomerase family protein [Acidimicrobiales bacterium]